MGPTSPGDVARLRYPCLWSEVHRHAHVCSLEGIRGMRGVRPVRRNGGILGPHRIRLAGKESGLLESTARAAYSALVSVLTGAHHDE